MSFSKQDLKEILDKIFGTGNVAETVFIQAPNIAERFLASSIDSTEWYTENCGVLDYCDEYIDKFCNGKNPESTYFNTKRNKIIEAWNSVLRQEYPDSIKINKNTIDIQYDNTIGVYFDIEMEPDDLGLDSNISEYKLIRYLENILKSVRNIVNLNGMQIIIESVNGNCYVRFKFPKIIFPLIRKY